MNKRWTVAEKNFIRENAHKLTDKQMAERLSGLTGRKVTLYAVRKQRQRMGVAKVSGRSICALRQKHPPKRC